MFDVKLRLVSMLGVLTILVLAGLIMDYLHIGRRWLRVGFSAAILGIVAGIGLTLFAVLPDLQLYGKVVTAVPTADRKVVALTFDDGPYPPYTGQVLDVLRQEQVKATFFVIGQNAVKHPDLVRQIAAEGHQIGNHTYQHLDLLKLDREAIAQEIDRTGQVLQEITGSQSRILRPPHGFRDPVVMEAAAERNLQVVEWSVMARDWVNPGAAVIAQRVLERTENGSIILLHDGDGVAAAASRSQTAQATGLIIRGLRERGFEFVTIEEIMRTTGEKKG